jgi:hypothetical protein
MFMQILSHTPVYVWVLLAALTTLGLLQTRRRRVAPMRLVALPAVLLGLGLWSMAPAFRALPISGAAWLAALALGAAAGLRMRLAPGTAWLDTQRRFDLPGSWMPMALVLVIFLLRYAVGVGSALHPDWRNWAGLQVSLAVTFGLLAGLQLGRTGSLLRLSRGAPARSTAGALGAG